MRVAFVSSDWSPVRDPDGNLEPGGAGWYRCVMPAQALAAHGIDATVAPGLGWTAAGELFPASADNVADRSGYDVIVLQRLMHQDGPRLIRLARSTGQTVLNDVDDWFDGIDQKNAAFLSSHPRESPTANRDHFRRILGAGDGIIASTPYLASRLARLGRPIEVVRNAIDLARWPDRSDQLDVPAVGWVGATPWRSGDLDTLRGVLGPWLDRTGWRFAHHGDPLADRGDGATWPWLRSLGGWQHSPAAAMIGLNPERHVASIRPWLPIGDYPDLFTGFSVGLVPLADVPFNQAKSWVKGVEYAASGIPFIAAATNEYRALGVGRICRRPSHWIAALDDLSDESTRRAAAAAARRRVAELDIGVCWQNWADAIGRLAAA